MLPDPSGSPLCLTHRCVYRQPSQLNHMKCSFCNPAFCRLAFVLHLSLLALDCSAGTAGTICSSYALVLPAPKIAVLQLPSWLFSLFGTPPSSPFPDVANCPSPFSVPLSSSGTRDYKSLACKRRAIESRSIISLAKWTADHNQLSGLCLIDR